jgi:hypothetical protein
VPMPSIEVAQPKPVEGKTVRLTRHALGRLDARGFRLHAIQAVLRYGRVVHIRGAAIHVIGWREVEQHKRSGINLIPFEGIQVICDPWTGAILTVYRNRDLRGLRPRGRRRAVRRRPPVRTLRPVSSSMARELDTWPEGQGEAA